jgi:hypothetical protein
MKIDLVQIWASPSTLHLRLVYGPDSGKWIRSQELHVPWAALPGSTRDMLSKLVDDEREEEQQESLF